MAIITCNKMTPWDGTYTKGDRVQHPDAVEVGEQQDGYPGGDIVRYECPHCGTTFKVELPQ